MTQPAPPVTLSPAAKAFELARPVALTALFVAVGSRWGWWAAAPVALAAVFAWSILVHDLIHNALRLGPVVGEVALAVAAQGLVKSGHALRALHTVHHRRCLDESDTEGNVALVPFGRLVVFGPWLALRARAEAWRESPATRGWQLAETAGNLAGLALLAGIALATRSPGPLVYWAAVVAVTVTAPIWGAKIPHMVPYDHPWVRRLASFTGRLTPATASVLLHELHHRRPGLPVSLLAAHQGALDATAPSDCARRMGHAPDEPPTR
jgi:fatty acid desaturase